MEPLRSLVRGCAAFKDTFLAPYLPEFKRHSKGMYLQRFLSLLLFTSFLVIAGCTSSSPTVIIADESAEDASDKPVVAVIDGLNITLDDFKAHYDRNGRTSATQAQDLAEYQDFLTRFVDFRLKVLQARKEGLDQDPTLQEEIDQYRLQLARPYLFEREIFEPLVREMYDRRLEAVDASHILITVSKTDSPEDTLNAWTQLSAVRDSVVAGADFGLMAARFSQDPSAAGSPGSPGYQGQLGFFGGGRMVEEFEDMAFNTEVGQTSEIFRTDFGYHILHVSGRKPMPADRALAHIMIRPAANTPAEQADTEQRLGAVLARLEAGEVFGEVARALSDDQNSAPQGGAIGTLAFDAGLPFTFRDAAFAIEQPGDWTGPVQTPFGIHFIQFVDETPLASFEEEYDRLKTRISQMPRAQKAEKEFAANTRKEVGTWVDSTLVSEWAGEMALDSLIRWLALSDFEESMDSKPVMRLGNREIGLQEFAEYFRTSIVSSGFNVEDRVFAVMDKYFDDLAIEWEINRLEERDVDFATTMTDFRDGLLLFRFMEQMVWNKAAQDSTGLLAHYEANQDSYQYQDRTRVISYSSRDETVLRAFVDSVQENGLVAALEGVASDSTISLRADTTWVTEPTGSLFDEVLTVEPGSITDSKEFNQGWLALYNDGIEAARAMTLDEARSQVVGEYQVVLEEKLISDLRTAFGVEVYPSVLELLVEIDSGL